MAKTILSKKTSTHGTPSFCFRTPIYKPQTPQQQVYVNYLKDKSVSMVLGVGPAGCGKTLFSCVAAMNEYEKGAIKKIIMTRPIVSVEEELGFLPGKIEQKMDPWTRPMFDIFYEFFPRKEVENMVRSGIIEIAPLAYMRGRTFKNAFVICDEMQNSSPNQMLMLATRIGEGSKMVITGDLEQSDFNLLAPKKDNGLSDFINKYNNYDGDKTKIKLATFSKNDVKRSTVVVDVLNIYENCERTEKSKKNFVTEIYQ
jgi:phosphate starvation-inducible PhoH-like protein